MSQSPENSGNGKTVSDCEIGIKPRLDAPHILLQHGISCAVWAEDALRHYGVRTVLFDLFLLVENPAAAAQCLESAGYSRALPCPNYETIPELYALPRFKKGPFSETEDYGATYVALLQAQQYRYELSPASTITSFIPSLPALVDSIIDAWLDATTTDYAMHLGSHLAYLCDYCPKARDPLFISELKHEHQDFYRRYLTNPFLGGERKEWRRVRDSFITKT